MKMNELIKRIAPAINTIFLNPPVVFANVDCERIVRAVIEGMREPTRAMLAAAENNGAYCDWQAMIDAALASQHSAKGE
jgi:hypothetical protein